MSPITKISIFKDDKMHSAHFMHAWPVRLEQLFSFMSKHPAQTAVENEATWHWYELTCQHLFSCNWYKFNEHYAAYNFLTYHYPLHSRDIIGLVMSICLLRWVYSVIGVLRQVTHQRATFFSRHVFGYIVSCSVEVHSWWLTFEPMKWRITCICTGRS